MKANQLKEIIRGLVREEVSKIFKEELQKNLVEIITNSNNKIASLKNNVETVSESQSSSTPPVKKQQKFVKYTSNQLLNQVLNETTGGVPQESSAVGLMGGDFKSSMLNESEIIQQPEIPENARKEIKVVHEAMTRDYRDLMKAIDNKKG